MISSVRGTVLAAGTVAVIEVGGVGLAVQVTPQHALTLRVGHEASLHTALIVREDDLSLFGFATRDELEVFDLLRGVSGVGPKSALGRARHAQPRRDRPGRGGRRRCAVPQGVGHRPEDRETHRGLARRQARRRPAPRPDAPRAASDVAENVVAALVGLGWTERVAAAAVDEALDDGAPDGRADRAGAAAALARAARPQLPVRGVRSRS